MPRHVHAYQAHRYNTATTQTTMANRQNHRRKHTTSHPTHRYHRMVHTTREPRQPSRSIRPTSTFQTNIRFVRFVTPHGRHRAGDRHHTRKQVDRIRHARVRCNGRRGHHANPSDETMDMAVDGSVHVASRGIPRRTGHVRIDALPCTRHPHANGKP